MPIVPAASNQKIGLSQKIKQQSIFNQHQRGDTVIKYGVIYGLANELTTNVLKVGRTSRIDRRLAQHNNASNTIGRWEVAWTISVPLERLSEAEKKALTALRRWKVSGRREQFNIDAQAARKIVALELYEFDEWGRREQERRERKRLARLENARVTLEKHEKYTQEFARINRTWVDDWIAHPPDWIVNVLIVMHFALSILIGSQFGFGYGFIFWMLSIPAGLLAWCFLGIWLDNWARGGAYIEPTGLEKVPEKSLHKAEKIIQNNGRQ